MSSGQPSRRNDCMRPAKFGFGQPVRRKEDEAFLRGSGRYVADFAPQDLCHAAVLRSPHAHARFRIENAAAARGMPGVRLVLTAADVAELGFLPCTASVPDQTIAVPPYPIVANGEALHVGDCLAFVVADTLFQAQDAVEAIALEWEALPCVVDGRAALADGAPRVATRSEEHTSELQSRENLVCRLLLEKKKNELAYRLCGTKKGGQIL